jgi:two-component system sensor histidine kinase VicK
MSVDNYILPANIFQTIFEKSPGSILVKADTQHFTILAVSDTYLKVTSTKREAILGKGFFEVFPDDETQLIDEKAARHVFTKVIKTGEKVDIPSYRYDVYNIDTDKKELHYWSCSNIPIWSDGKIAYILNSIADITEEVKARESALESASRLRLATEVTGLATWDMDLQHHGFYYSPRMVEIFGQPPGTVLTVGSMRSQMSADDMQNIVRKSFKEALITGEHLYEIKIVWPDESVHWIKTQGTIIFDENKRPVRMLGTVLDITESKRDEIRKNDFIAMASHELKTPLTSLKAYLQLVEKKIVQINDPFITNALAKAGNQVNKMADLIYGFLDLSRLESGKLPVKMQLFDMNQLIIDTIAETNLVNYSHNIIFKPGDEKLVNADREKISQVITNFLGNAIKYSPKESPITVTCKIVDNCVQVAVTDKGIGIKHRDQEKLFQRFYRVENEKLKNVSGFGIGLYLASEIIQRHKGKIWVDSEEDEGSTFYFSLPVTVGG